MSRRSRSSINIELLLYLARAERPPFGSVSTDFRSSCPEELPASKIDIRLLLSELIGSLHRKKLHYKSGAESGSFSKRRRRCSRCSRCSSYTNWPLDSYPLKLAPPSPPAF